MTGFFLWYGERDTRFRLPSALLVHDWLMYVSLVLFLGHLWLALVKPSTRHSMSGITRGWVRADWARRHHAKWVAAIEGGADEPRPRRCRRADTQPDRESRAEPRGGRRTGASRASRRTARAVAAGRIVRWTRP